MAAKLTTKQQAWVDYYKQGFSLADAARKAGYRAGSDNAFQSIGSENLRKLAACVKERDSLLEAPRVAEMEEVNAFWTAVMRSRDERTADRLKASELRARAAGAFMEKVRHSGGVEIGANPYAGLTTEELRELIEEL